MPRKPRARTYFVFAFKNILPFYAKFRTATTRISYRFEIGIFEIELQTCRFNQRNFALAVVVYARESANNVAIFGYKIIKVGRNAFFFVEKGYFYALFKPAYRRHIIILRKRIYKFKSFIFKPAPYKSVFVDNVKRRQTPVARVVARIFVFRARVNVS